MSMISAWVARTVWSEISDRVSRIATCATPETTSAAPSAMTVGMSD